MVLIAPIQWIKGLALNNTLIIVFESVQITVTICFWCGHDRHSNLLSVVLGGALVSLVSLLTFVKT